MIADKSPYTASISERRLCLQKPQKQNNFTQKTIADGLEDRCEEVNSIFQHQKLSYILKIIKTEIIS